MDEKHCFEQLLGVESPWEVSNVEINSEKLCVGIWIVWAGSNKASCPECKKESSIYDYRSERQWRHLDTMQFETIVRSRIPRVNCKEHGLKSIEVPWAEPSSRFTLLFEGFAIKVLSSCENQTRAMELLGISWDQMHRIQEQAVRRGMERRKEEKISYVGIDEKSFLRGHRYATIISDIKGGRVLEVIEDRKEAAAREGLQSLSTEVKGSIEAVAVDMWPAYINAVQEELPEATIVHDKFHIVKYLNEAVDKVRKKEQGMFLKAGEKLLTGTKYLWLKNHKNFSEEEEAEFGVLQNKGLKVGRAWTIKEYFTHFWKYQYPKSARAFFKKWYFWATHSRLLPMIKVAQMIKRHFDHIITYCRFRITNAVAEGLNSKIQVIKSAARGFRNFKNYRIAILFYCGNLDMLPHYSQ